MAGSAIQGPALFLAQFLGDAPPYDTLPNLAAWASALGYVGVQIPTWDARVLDLRQAATSQAYCDEQRGVLAEYGLEVAELASYLQGQVMAMHPAYERLFQPFYPDGLNDAERVAWASEQLRWTVEASVRMGRKALGEERPLNVSHRIPVHKCVAVMDEQDEGRCFGGREFPFRI